MLVRCMQLAAFGLSLLSSLSSIALLGLSAYLIAAASLQPELYTLALPITGVRAFGILRALLRYGERYIGHAAAFALSARVSRGLFLYLSGLLPLRRSSGENQGSLLHRLNRAAEEWRSFYLRGVTPLLVSLLLAMLAAAVLHGLGGLSPLCSWLPLWCWLAVAGIAWLGERKQLALTAEYSAYRHRLLDLQAGREELLATGSRAWAEAQLDMAAHSLWQAGRRQGLCRSLTGLAIRLMLVLPFCLLLAELWESCSLGRMSFVEAALLAVSVQALLGEFAGLEEAVRHVLSAGRQATGAGALPAGGRELADAALSASEQATGAGALWAGRQEPRGNCLQYTKNSSQIWEDSSIMDVRKVGVEAENVCFSYDGQNRVLSHVSFAVLEGEKAAVLGDSGCGKTTLFYLLLGVWQPDSGALQGSLLQDAGAISAITQDVYVFDATIAGLFRRLCPECSEAEMWQALELSRLADFVRGLPGGTEYHVGQDGYRLSGGQRQRLLTALAAARAISRGSRLILLDEPTCGLDRHTGEQMLAGLLEFFADRTMLVITHDEYVAEMFKKKILL